MAKRKKGRFKSAKSPGPAVGPKPVLDLERIDPWRIKIKKTGSMRVEGLVFLSRELERSSAEPAALAQAAAVAQLPGIVGQSLAMPDMHWGYGFPIGGVAAFDAAEGVVSPGGVGYDINCGCRLLASDLAAHEVRPQMENLVESLFRAIPCGVGSQGAVKISGADLKKVLRQGAGWAAANGWAREGDVDHIEDRGCLPGADPAALSERALTRGKPQLGTLGSGNHFLELDVVEEIYDDPAARTFGLFQGQLVMQLHSGSRGLGYQVCDDALKQLLRWSAGQGVSLPDRQLVYAPLKTPQAEQYLAAMAGAANYAYANRQIMSELARRAVEEALGVSPAGLNFRLVIDVCHNIAKMERHIVDGQERLLCVHRKGATRAFAAGRPELPPDYRDVGQPVLIPGDMGTASYVLIGRPGAMAETFGSTCHGAGRVMSRTQAKAAARGRSIDREMADRGIAVRATGRGVLAEEAPEAYKDVSQVVETVHRAGLSTKVARLRPLGVIKG